MRSIAPLIAVIGKFALFPRLKNTSTCLTLDQAMKNARLLARPDRDWLNP